MIMDWNCYRKRHLGQEDYQNDVKLGAACSRWLAQAVRRLIYLPFLFHIGKCLLFIVN